MFIHKLGVNCYNKDVAVVYTMLDNNLGGTNRSDIHMITKTLTKRFT